MAEEVVQPPPSPSRDKKGGSFNIEIAAAVLLGVLAIAFSAWQVRTAGPSTTGTQTFLFNCLQFICTAGFAWFSTKAASRHEFQQSLKQFAISAYRRVADIERIVNRLHDEITDMIAEAPKSEITNLRIVDAIVSDTSHVVRSSISDWGDVIGEELLAIEQVKRLEQEKAQLEKNERPARPGSRTDDVRREVEKLTETIASIVSTLPPKLQLETEAETSPSRAVRRAARTLARDHHAEDGLRLNLFTRGGIYPSERDYQTLKRGEPLFIIWSKDREGGMDATDKAGRTVGRLLNRTNLPYDQMTQAMEMCFGPPPIALEFLTEGEHYPPEADENKGEETVSLEVRVRSIPLLKLGSTDKGR